MKTMLLVVLAITFGGCATSKAPMICKFATAPEVEKAVRGVMDDLPDSNDKTEAALALKVAKLSADAGCTALKAVEAKHAAKAVEAQKVQ